MTRFNPRPLASGRSRITRKQREERKMDKRNITTDDGRIRHDDPPNSSRNGMGGGWRRRFYDLNPTGAPQKLTTTDDVEE